MPLLPGSVTIPTLFSDKDKEKFYVWSKEKGDSNHIFVKITYFYPIFAIFSRFYDLVSRMFQHVSLKPTNKISLFLFKKFSLSRVTLQKYYKNIEIKDASF